MEGTPFRYQGPVSPSLLIDRENELATLGRRAADRVAVRLAGPRRYGKTSLLHAHAKALRDVGWRTAYVDCAHVTDLDDLARRIISAYAPLDVRWVRGRLGALRPQLGIELSAHGEVSMTGAVERGSPEAAEDAIYRVLDLPLAVAERAGEPTLICFDEFQDVLTARRDLDGILRSRIQHHGDAAAYVYAGSEPSLMAALFSDRERPFYGQADPLSLEPLDTYDLAAALDARFEAEDLDPGEVLGEIVAIARGHPQRTMLLAYCLAERLVEGKEPIADAVVNDALVRTADAHESLWEAAGALERVVLAAVASGGPPTSQGLARSHRVSQRGLARAAKRLVDRGTLARHGARDWSVVDPLLAAWLLRRHFGPKWSG